MENRKGCRIERSLNQGIRRLSVLDSLPIDFVKLIGAYTNVCIYRKKIQTLV